MPCTCRSACRASTWTSSWPMRPKLDIHGLSVTIPHKEAVAKKLDVADESLTGIGAANTLLFKDGKITGYNTDYRARSAAWKKPSPNIMAGPTRRSSTRPRWSWAPVARRKAIAYGLKKLGATVVIAGRTAERAEQLAKSLECKTVDWSSRYSVHPDVIVNCTPVGMHPNVDATPYDKHHLRPSMIVFDTVYNPENTLLLKEARSQSCTVVSGVEMFVRQARLQFQQFTGQDPPAELMRDVLKRAIGPAKY